MDGEAHHSRQATREFADHLRAEVQAAEEERRRHVSSVVFLLKRFRAGELLSMDDKGAFFDLNEDELPLWAILALLDEENEMLREGAKYRMDDLRPSAHELLEARITVASIPPARGRHQ
ncbi:protein of unknown function (plasmid) [Magnetospirillum sp. XM-1]|uniref:hypothetical protein n=1 Tax=Magnetospirillum sp. XM-1 TaxID=1663591 RepID=UPI00073E0DDC|nr:hypothetical protein [Magnetospirillum sp. XM-1]CUW41916.1 protein of unknown function [Magnetospirillum sp. XM-1]